MRRFIVCFSIKIVRGKEIFRTNLDTILDKFMPTSRVFVNFYKKPYFSSIDAQIPFGISNYSSLIWNTDWSFWNFPNFGHTS